MSGLALLAGGRPWRLPEGVAPLPPQAPRPLPRLGEAPPGLLGLVLLEGQAVPVLAPGGAPGPVWLACHGPAGRLVLTGEALLDPAPPGALPLPWPLAGEEAAPASFPGLAAAPSLAPPPAAPRPAAAPRPRPEVLALGLGEAWMAVPLALLARVVPAPALEPVPGRPRGALGLGLASGLGPAGEVPVPVLDPRWLDPTLPETAAPPLLAVLAVEGRLCALPCDRAVPVIATPDGVTPGGVTPDGATPNNGAMPDGAAPPGLLEAALAKPEAAALRALCPPWQPRPPRRAEPLRPLLLARAGALLFALPVEEVAAVVPPQRPAPVPGQEEAREEGPACALAPLAEGMAGGLAGGGVRGVVSHRGDVLPVRDAGEALGIAPVLAGPEAAEGLPLLRLAGPAPVALAVSAVLGLRHVPEAAITALPPAEGAGGGEGLVAALAGFQGRPLPVCRAAWLAGRATPARPAKEGAEGGA
ncbi:chemotaxis protein CheW [Roseomonas sp. GC11]|uniref:chemotaxis protein CheW n=1 Tax=Roseomonas sp. GC11 TaxID=2950546 RepID=UPI002108B2C1|nr:chemotaxis protein CheW [Roseomonas sp. GC11]MCQ4162444.1 chemotaxis protein CheW [Roseomonas sp. GC11]